MVSSLVCIVEADSSPPSRCTRVSSSSNVTLHSSHRISCTGRSPSTEVQAPKKRSVRPIEHVVPRTRFRTLVSTVQKQSIHRKKRSARPSDYVVPPDSSPDSPHRPMISALACLSQKIRVRDKERLKLEEDEALHGDCQFLTIPPTRA